jgi:hypothetical protein
MLIHTHRHMKKIDARFCKVLGKVLLIAATFRRLGKIEQAMGAIQLAEVRDESNPGNLNPVIVHVATAAAILQRLANFHEFHLLLISTEDVPATAPSPSDKANS